MTIEYFGNSEREIDINNQASLYLKSITLADAGESNAIFLPICRIDNIGISNTAEGVEVYATFANKEDIEDDTADWDLWNGSDLLNFAITAIKIINNSGGEATTRLSVRGSL